MDGVGWIDDGSLLPPCSVSFASMLGLFCIDDGSLWTQVGDRWMVLDLRLAHKEGELLSLVQILKSQSSIVALDSRYTRALNFEHLHQGAPVLPAPKRALTGGSVAAVAAAASAGAHS